MLESQDNLKRILQDKLLEYEANVPGTSEDFILKSIRPSVGSRILSRSLLYSTILLLSISAYFVIQPGAIHSIGNEQMTPVKESGGEKMTSANNETKSHLPIQKDAHPEKKTSDKALPLQKKSKLSADRNETELSNSFQPVLGSSLIVGENTISTDPTGKPNLDTLVSQSVAALVQHSDSVPLQVREEKISKLRLNLSVMPFLGYRIITPTGGDGVSLSNFKTPSSLSGQRLGFKTAISIDYELKKNKSVFAGVSYFRYQTQFTYNSNEVNNQVNTTNSVNETVQGVSFLAGGRYPLKIKENRKQFVSAGIDAQWLIGNYNPLTSKSQLMINIGYTNDFSIGKDHTLRLQPTFNYSLTKFHYGGLVTQPYWVGLEIGYTFGLK